MPVPYGIDIGTVRAASGVFRVKEAPRMKKGHDFFSLICPRHPSKPIPTNPVPNRSTVPGSGTGLAPGSG